MVKKKAKKKSVKRKTVKRKPVKKKRTKKRVSKKKKPEVVVAVNSKWVATASFLLNLLLPGFGSIIGRRSKTGSSQLLLWAGSWLVGILLWQFNLDMGISLGSIIGFVGGAIAWVWALMTSIDLFKHSI